MKRGGVSGIGQSIDKVSEIIGEKLTDSFVKEAFFEDKKRNLNDFWDNIRKREDKYAENASKLADIRMNISNAKNVLKEDLENAHEQLNLLFAEETERLQDISSKEDLENRRRNALSEKISDQKRQLSKLSSDESKLREREFKIERTMNETRIKDANTSVHDINAEIRRKILNIDDLTAKIDLCEDNIRKYNANIIKTRQNITDQQEKECKLMKKIGIIRMNNKNEKDEKRKTIRSQSTEKEAVKAEGKTRKEDISNINRNKIATEFEIEQKEAELRRINKQIKHLESEAFKKEKRLKIIEGNINENRVKENAAKEKKDRRERAILETFSNLSQQKLDARKQEDKEKRAIANREKDYKELQAKNTRMIEKLGKVAEQEQEIENLERKIDREFFAIDYNNDYHYEEQENKLLDEYNALSKKVAAEKVKLDKNEKLLKSKGIIINANKDIKTQQEQITTLHKLVKKVLAANLKMRKAVHVLERKNELSESQKIVVSAKTDILNSDREIINIKYPELKDVITKISKLQKNIAAKKRKIAKLSKEAESYSAFDDDSKEEILNALENISSFIEYIKEEKRKISNSSKDLSTTNLGKWSNKVRYLISSLDNI